MKTKDRQYKDLIQCILDYGERVSTPQDVDALTCFGTAKNLVYDLANGDPIITERKMGIKAPIAEMCAFINGEQDFDIMKEKFGVPEAFWGPWVVDRKTKKVGAKKRCLGDGSYGRAFAAFPDNEGGTFNQIENIIRMLSDDKLKNRRTIYMTSWIPFMNGWGRNQKTVVSPCHGFVHFRHFDGKLDLVSWHRSADTLLGLPNDMISYTALLRMIASVTNLIPRRIIYQLSDVHIYENQIEEAKEILSREDKILPELKIINKKERIEDYRKDDFEIIDYNFHKALKISSAV